MPNPDDLDIPGQIQETLATVDELRRRLDTAMIETRGSRPNAQTNKFSTQAAALAQAVKALSTEARLWAAQAAERAGNASAERKTAVCIKWLTQLPVGIRSEAYKALEQAEALTAAPIPLKVG